MRLLLLFAMISLFSCRESCKYESANYFVLDVFKNGINVNQDFKEKGINYIENAQSTGLVRAGYLNFDSLSSNFQGSWRNGCPKGVGEFEFLSISDGQLLDTIQFTINRYEEDGCVKCSYDGARSYKGNDISLGNDTFYIKVEL